MRNTIIIVVASSDMMGQLSAFRAFVKMVVSLAAPGVHILLFHVAMKNGYKYDSGTSFAAAHVTGVLACISTLHGIHTSIIMQSHAYIHKTINP
jgi:subtilisin family serine protease